MKAVTFRESYPATTLVGALTAGRPLVVTAKGKTKSVVAKSGRPRMTVALAEKRAVGTGSEAEFDGVAFLRSLKR